MPVLEVSMTAEMFDKFTKLDGPGMMAMLGHADVKLDRHWDDGLYGRMWWRLVRRVSIMRQGAFSPRIIHRVTGAMARYMLYTTRKEATLVLEKVNEAAMRTKAEMRDVTAAKKLMRSDYKLQCDAMAVAVYGAFQRSRGKRSAAVVYWENLYRCLLRRRASVRRTTAMRVVMARRGMSLARMATLLRRHSALSWRCSRRRLESKRNGVVDGLRWMATMYTVCCANKSVTRRVVVPVVMQQPLGPLAVFAREVDKLDPCEVVRLLVGAVGEDPIETMAEAVIYTVMSSSGGVMEAVRASPHWGELMDITGHPSTMIHCILSMATNRWNISDMEIVVMMCSLRMRNIDGALARLGKAERTCRFGSKCDRLPLCPFVHS